MTDDVLVGPSPHTHRRPRRRWWHFQVFGATLLAVPTIIGYLAHDYVGFRDIVLRAWWALAIVTVSGLLTFFRSAAYVGNWLRVPLAIGFYVSIAIPLAAIHVLPILLLGAEMAQPIDERASDFHELQVVATTYHASILHTCDKLELRQGSGFLTRYRIVTRCARSTFGNVTAQPVGSRLSVRLVDGTVCRFDVDRDQLRLVPNGMTRCDEILR